MNPTQSLQHIGRRKRMAIYLISYDLHKRRDYPTIQNGIIALGAYTKPLESVWLVESDLAVFAVRDHLRKFVDNDDSFFVIKVDAKNWGSFNIPQSSVNWK